MHKVILTPEESHSLLPTILCIEKPMNEGEAVSENLVGYFVHGIKVC